MCAFFEKDTLPQNDGPIAVHMSTEPGRIFSVTEKNRSHKDIDIYEKKRGGEVWRDVVRTIRLTIHKPIIEINAGSGPVLVLGSAMSGTTWIADVIAHMTKARQIFEPFILHRQGQLLFTAHRELTDVECDLNFQLYLRPDSPGGRYKNQIANILFKVHRNSWCDQMCRHGFYRKRLIKDVRANLFMTYIALNWPSLKILWVVRNPVHVVESQAAMREAGYNIDWNVGQIKSQPELLQDWLSPFLAEIEAAKRLPERLCHKWCIENFIPLKQHVASLQNVLLVRYDRLVGDLEAWGRIMSFVGYDRYDVDRLRRVTAKPSRVSRKVVVGTGGGAEKKHLSSRDIDYIEHGVRLYGLERLLV
jgi:hypothetical protein